MSLISRRALLATVHTRLTVGFPGPGPAPTVYKGEIPTSPPTENGRVKPYIVLYGGVGNPRVEEDLAETADELDWPIHLLCVAGWLDDCLHLVDRTHTHLFRWAPVVDGLVVGHLTTPPGYDPGPPRELTRVEPVRFESPLQYRLTATAS